VLDAQAGQRAPHVREVVAIDRPAGLGRAECPARAVRVEADSSLVLGSGQIMCSLQTSCSYLDERAARI
jgi:hypothetical protein